MCFHMNNERKFIPAGIIICAGILIVGGIALGVIGTSVVALKEDVALYLRTGLVLFKTSNLKDNYLALFIKSLLGIAMVVTGIRLALCKKNSRTMAIALLSTIGIGMPIFIKIQMSKIDFEFIYAFQIAVFIISTGTVYYLTRPSSVSTVAEGGLPVEIVSTYCPICEITLSKENTKQCPACECDMLSLYETKDGQRFAEPIQNAISK